MISLFNSRENVVEMGCSVSGISISMCTFITHFNAAQFSITSNVLMEKFCHAFQ